MKLKKLAYIFICAFCIIFVIIIAIQKENTEIVAADRVFLLNIYQSYRIPTEPVLYSGNVVSKNTSPENRYGADNCYLLTKNDQIEFVFHVEEAGEYNILLSYYHFQDTFSTLDISLKVNDRFQFLESESMRLPIEWQDDSEPLTNRYGDEVVPKQSIARKWYSENLRDAKGNKVYPYTFYFEKGENKVSITNLKTDFILAGAGLTKVYTAPDYQSYKSLYNGNTINTRNTYEAEITASKNKASITADSTFDVNITPYDTNYLRINLIGYNSFLAKGDEVSWMIEAPETGFYYITFKGKQKDGEMVNAPVFRTILIDGQIPFSEMESYKFEYMAKWTNHTLQDENKNPYMIYFEKGFHKITMRIDNSIYTKVNRELEEVNNEISELALQIKKMTGNTTDRNRDWDLSEFLPDLSADLLRWQEILLTNYQYITSLSEKETKASVTLKEAYNALVTLAKNPNNLPNQMSALSDGGSSVIFMITNSIEYIDYQPFAIDKFYIHGNTELPKEEVGMLLQVKESAKRFMNTFKKDPYENTYRSDTEVTVWINRSRSFVDALQQLIDTEFTPKTGIQVTLSIMPAEDKIILANASKTNPDMALGLSTNMPYELGVREAVVDLSKMSGFLEVMKQFKPGAFLSYVIDESIYALPETQDFWTLVYRKDILEKLNLEIPDTWDDVLAMLPVLQRYGMNFVPSLSTFTSYKPFAATLPFILQYGGSVIHDDGMTTAITDETSLEGIKLMTELFVTYSMPEQVSNFYSHFKLGDMPIGIGNLATYLQLSFAADELAGKWALAPLPGVKNENGDVVRYAPGSATSCVIFENSDKIEDAWEFLKWYMDTETQINYSNLMFTKYGDGYIWNTANIYAFEEALLPDEDKEIILDQWEWLVETPKIPGHYMIERQLSNVWNKVVFDGMNVREAVDDAAIKINHEIYRKMEDYKYIVDGIFVRQYRIPTIDTIENWGGNSNE